MEDLAAAQTVVPRKPDASPRIDDVRLERWAEGRCVQMMHVGPYATEQETFDAMAAWVVANGESLVPPTVPATPASGHHETYLGDPQRTDPAKLKTVLRRRLQSPA